MIGLRLSSQSGTEQKTDESLMQGIRPVILVGRILGVLSGDVLNAKPSKR